MIQISVSSEIENAIRQLQTISEAQQFRFAVAKALTATAVEVQKEVRKNMPGRFTLRRQWVVNGILVERATKDNLTATVYSRDKFMGLQEVGGPKSPLRQYLALPTSMVRRTKTDMITKADRPKNLGDKAEVIEYEGRKWLALKRPRKGANNQRLRLLYLLVPRAQLQKRLGLGEDAQKIARLRFSANLRDAMEFALRTARR